ncbi:proline-rich protein 12-like [Zingiber officinale]|uniref:proline-rich protein 12-like n=1 Tax=Zingiber officinale TaxID=94328 RepID=UPI001C4B47EE|nr:proline-rich protein 12-like [Zingiber officinale]
MRRSTRAFALRRGVRRPRKRTLESLATDLLEIPIGVEPVGQGPTQDTAGASGSQTPIAPLEVPTSVAPIIPTPIVFTVRPAVPSAYLVPPPPVPTAYQAPPPPVPTAHPAPAPAAAVAPPPVPPPTVPPVAPTYTDPAVPPVAPALAYATTPGISPPTYPAVPPVVPPVGPAPVVPPVHTAVPTQLIDIVAARARILALAKSMKCRFTVFCGETNSSVAQSWIETLEQTFFYMTCSEWEKAELVVFHLRDEADIWWDTQRSIIELVAEDRSRMLQFIQGLDGHLQVQLASFGSSSYLETLDRTLMIESAQHRAFLDRKRKQMGPTSGQIQQPQATRKQQSGHSRPGQGSSGASGQPQKSGRSSSGHS